MRGGRIDLGHDYGNFRAPTGHAQWPAPPHTKRGAHRPDAADAGSARTRTSAPAYSLTGGNAPTNPDPVEHSVLDVEVLDVKRVTLNKVPSWLHIIAHQCGKNLICGNCIFDGYLK